MSRLLFLAILIGGVVLLVLGINSSNSLGSDISKFFTGSPTDKAVWMMIGGVVLSIIGLIGVSRRSSPIN